MLFVTQLATRSDGHQTRRSLKRLYTALKFPPFCLVLLGLLAQIQNINSIRPSVYYIEGTTPFFKYQGMTFDYMDANIIKLANSKCQCRIMCIAWEACTSWSDITNATGQVECRLSILPPNSLATVNLTEGNIFYKRDKMAGSFFMSEDSLMYYDPSMTSKYPGAMSFCGAIPGFRLIIFKYLNQTSVAQEIGDRHTKCWLNLKKNDQGIAVWGDGVTFPDSEISQAMTTISVTASEKYFRLDGLEANDIDGFSDYCVLCQANPLGVAW